jgi:thiol-disulfide isomerase/thioredoxin
MVTLHVALAALALSSTGQTVLYDFYADWCGPCKAMNPTVEALANAGYPVQRVNIDQNRPLAAKYHIQSIPCFVMVVDGREIDRVTGGTTYSRLERMCQTGAANRSMQASPSLLAINGPPAIRPTGFPASAPMSKPFDGWGNMANANPPIPQQNAASGGVSDAALLAATVRLRVEDPDGHSCGSGTIVDARDGEALILTCGHLFRDSKGQGKIEVDLFGPGGPQRAEGRLISYDADSRDIGLVAIHTPGPVMAARVAPPGYRIDRGMSVASVGCNNGDDPTVRHSQINSLDKFAGPSNIQVAGQPVEGRSGGGLFTNEGYVIGVCNAADPSDREGLFAALSSIYAELDRNQLSFIYKSPSGGSADAQALANAAPPMGNNIPPIPNPMSNMPAVALDSGNSRSAVEPAVAAIPAMQPSEQAALDEIRREKREGAEVVIIVRPRNKPDAKSEVFMLDNASSDFVKQVAGMSQPKQERHLTSLELPKPRKTLLEWSAEK